MDTLEYIPNLLKYLETQKLSIIFLYMNKKERRETKRVNSYWEGSRNKGKEKSFRTEKKKRCPTVSEGVLEDKEVMSWNLTSGIHKCSQVRCVAFQIF